MGVVVDMGLAQVLLGDVAVRLVAVPESRVVVLVVVGGGQVGEVLTRPVVVGHMQMVMGMQTAS
jgi:hypothetical protein